MEQLPLLTETRQQRRRRVLRVALDSACPVRHLPILLYHVIINAKTFYQVKSKEALPVRDGFYGIVSEMETGDYRGVAWFETKTQTWWDVGSLTPVDSWRVTSWYGLSAELGGRQRRHLLED